MEKSKNGKAAGDDMIQAEILRGANEEGMLWMIEIINRCWRKGRTLENWNKSIICPIIKKGDKMDCKNNREIALITLVSKDKRNSRE